MSKQKKPKPVKAWACPTNLRYVASFYHKRDVPPFTVSVIIADSRYYKVIPKLHRKAKRT
jgi:hypothetical protein